MSNLRSGGDAKEIAQYEFTEPLGEEQPFFSARVTLASCPRCGAPMLGYEDGTDPNCGWGTPVRVYPPRDRSVHYSVPKSIRQAFDEARTWFRAKASTAAAIMCRKTLEGVCSEHEVKSGTRRTESSLWCRQKTRRTRWSLLKRLSNTYSTTGNKFESFKKRRAKEPSASDKERAVSADL
jgi:hypothetical protein